MADVAEVPGRDQSSEGSAVTDVDTVERLKGELEAAKRELDSSTAELERMKKLLQEKDEQFLQRSEQETKDYISECEMLRKENSNLLEQLKEERRNSAVMGGITDFPDGGSVDFANIASTMEEAQRIFKVIMVGDSGVGKTTFVRHLASGTAPKSEPPMTVGVDFYTKSLRVSGELFSLKLWDTAGTERFRSITRSYFHDANGAILMYDVTRESTYTNVRRWMGDILDNAAESVVILLVGNKIDLQPDLHAGTRVSPEHGRTLAATYQAEFAEVSAHSGAGVMEACRVLCRALQKKEDDLILQARTTVDLEDEQKEATYCPC